MTFFYFEKNLFAKKIGSNLRDYIGSVFEE